MWQKLTLRDLQIKELDILLVFDKLCKENNLRYYLAGGTLLGAIRHKGFIPWDDDIDVCMPRPDYQKMLTKFGKLEGRYIFKSNLLGNLRMPFAKLVDMNTTIRMGYQDQTDENNLWIDIFPVDGLPANLNDVTAIYKECNIYRRLLLVSSARLGKGKNILHKYIKYFLKPTLLLYGPKKLVDKIERIAMRNKYRQSMYVGIVAWGLYGAGERMLKSEFEKPIEVEFEGHKLPAFSCWDTYLHGLYGDYMQLPPLRKRKIHDLAAYVVEN